MNARGHTNFVPWMYPIGPKNPLVKLNESDLTESTNCEHLWCGVGVTRVTAWMHSTELMWPRKVMVRSWCDCMHSRYKIDAIWYADLVWFRKSLHVVSVYTVHCTVGFIWRNLCLCLCAKVRKFTLRSQKNQHKVTLTSQSDFKSY